MKHISIALTFFNLVGSIFGIVLTSNSQNVNGFLLAIMSSAGWLLVLKYELSKE